MVVALVKLSIHVGGAHSLKEKRKQVKGLKEQIKSRFANASIAEVDHHDLYQRATYGIAVVAADALSANGQMDKIIALVNQRAEIIDLSTELVNR